MVRCLLFRDPVRWAQLGVGTRLRFVCSCVLIVCLGILCMLGGAVLMRFTELSTRMEVDFPFFEWSLVALVCGNIVCGAIFFPLTFLVALWGYGN